MLPFGRPYVAGSLSGAFKQVPRLRGDYRPRSEMLRQLAPILAPASGGVAYELDFDDASGVLKATIAVDDRIYTTSLDLSPVIECAMAKAAAYHDRLHAEEKARGTPLVGAVPFATVGADCGTRVYEGVTQRVLAEILRAVQAQGMTVEAKGNAFDVDTHQAGVTLHAVWDAAATKLSLSVDAAGVLCERAWAEIDPTLRAAINQAAGSASLLTHVEDAVQVAGEALVDGLVDHHCRTICGGWWGDLTRGIKHAVNDVEKDVKSAVHTVENTVKDLAPLIEKALPMVANAIIPGSGAIAGAIMGAATGSGSAQQVAQAAVNAAQQAASSDPTAAAMLQAAQQAVATTTAATHVAKTAAAAASGNQAAQQQMTQMATAAAQGDPAAAQAMQLANQAGSALTASPDQIAAAAQSMAGAAATDASSALQGATDAASAMPADLSQAVSNAISGWFSDLEHQVEGLAEGPASMFEHHAHHEPHHLHGKKAGERVSPVRSAERVERVSSVRSAEPERVLSVRASGDYATAEYLRAALEAISRAPRSAVYGIRRRRGVESVLLFPGAQDAAQWLSALDPSTVDYAAVFDARGGSPVLTSQLLGESGAAQGRMYADALSGPETGVSGNVHGGDDDGVPLVGATADALEGLRQRASDAAVQVHANTGKDVVAIVIRTDGTVASATYADSDAADDAFGHVTSLPFAYAAYYDAGDEATWPHPLNEAIGGAPAAAPPGHGIHRGVATVSP